MTLADEKELITYENCRLYIGQEVLSVRKVKEAVKELMDLFDKTRKDERFFELFNKIKEIFGKELVD